MYIFRVLLLSLLAAMFINRYQMVFKNLDTFRMFNIIKQKNSLSFDKYIGGITMTFFPVNLLMVPLILPILAMRNARISEFALKVQYIFMVSAYVVIALFLLIPMLPLLYLKIIVNSIYTSANNKREDFQG